MRHMLQHFSIFWILYQRGMGRQPHDAEVKVRVHSQLQGLAGNEHLKVLSSQKRIALTTSSYPLESGDGVQRYLREMKLCVKAMWEVVASRGTQGTKLRNA